MNVITCKRLTSCTRSSFTTGTPGHTLQGWISRARNGACTGKQKKYVRGSGEET